MTEALSTLTNDVQANLPLVTVYIVNRNYGRFLHQAIGSVLEQTYQNIEILVIDDASDDESSNLLALLESEPRIRIIRHSNPRGLTGCCNSAISASRGEFLMRLDADDYLDPKAVEFMALDLFAEPDAALVSCDYFEVYANGNNLRRHHHQKVNNSGLLTDIPPHGACMMVRRNFLSQMGGYDESIPCQDGVDLWLHLEPKHHTLSLGEPLIFYRQHAGNLTRDTRSLLQARTKIFAKHVVKRSLARPSVLAVVIDHTDPAVGMPLWQLEDRPLIEWTIDAALECKGLDRVVISSTGPETLNHVAKRYGSTIGCHHQVSSDLAATLDLELSVGRTYDAVLILNVTSPFQSKDLMQQAIHLMQLFGSSEVLGVQRDDAIFYRHDGLGLQPLQSEESVCHEADDLYRLCPGLRLLKLNSSAASGATMIHHSGRVGHVLVDQASAFTIRTELDWKLAQQIALSKLQECRVAY